MRQSGILMHISSLPSPYGIGTFGREAYRFVDFLKEAKQSLWQILPLGPTSFGDSPYQSFSTFAGNPYFVDLDLLREEGLLDVQDYQNIKWGKNEARIDYAAIYNYRFSVLKSAHARFIRRNLPDSYIQFCENEKSWLCNYALYMTLKEYNGGRSWHLWDMPYKMRERPAIDHFKKAHAKELDFWKFVQYQFYQQWFRLKQYANAGGIRIIGDLPIFVADDSADVWTNPSLFDLNEELVPNCVAGCPPDAFSKAGQLWGNPVYAWDVHKRDGYRWWTERMRYASTLYDIVRIDHFRGFDSFYTIPYGAATAVNGEWRQGPGAELFRKIKSSLGDIPVIAENLGFITDSVRRMLDECGYCGMNVLEFAFDTDDKNEHLPHHIKRDSVLYTGTHDNAPLAGWIKQISETERKRCLDYCGTDGMRHIAYKLIQTIFRTAADRVIVQMQDYLELDSRSRMNVPSTLTGNWQWRMNRKALKPALAERIAHITEMYGRHPKG